MTGENGGDLFGGGEAAGMGGGEAAVDTGQFSLGGMVDAAVRPASISSA